MFMIEGEFATLGFVAYLQKPAADKNSVIIDLLLEKGAVLYCKTSVPQGLTVSTMAGTLCNIAVPSNPIHRLLRVVTRYSATH